MTILIICFSNTNTGTRWGFKCLPCQTANQGLVSKCKVTATSSGKKLERLVWDFRLLGFSWCWGWNPGPFACSATALPLCYTPAQGIFVVVQTSASTSSALLEKELSILIWFVSVYVVRLDCKLISRTLKYSCFVNSSYSSSTQYKSGLSGATDISPKLALGRQIVPYFSFYSMTWYFFLAGLPICISLYHSCAVRHFHFAIQIDICVTTDLNFIWPLATSVTLSISVSIM